MQKAAALMIATVLAVAPAAAFAALSTFKDAANEIVTLINAATFTLVMIAVVLYMAGVTRDLFASAKTGKAIDRSKIVWGVVAIFVMVSVWGIVYLLQQTLFGSSYFDPTTGQAGYNGNAAPAQPLY